MTTQENTPESKLAQIFNLSDMSKAELDVFMERAGSIVLDAAVGRLLLDLDESALEDLQAYLAQVDEETDVLSHLLQTYSNFENLLLEEATALREEGESIG